jgi:DNA-binding response OmpR family regulator
MASTAGWLAFRGDATVNAPASRGRLLVVDDDPEMRCLLTEFLQGEGFEIDQAADGSEALHVARREALDGIVLDKNLPDASGLDILPRLRSLHPGAPVVLITAFGDSRTRQRAVSRGASVVLFKPFDLDDLLRAVSVQDEGPGAPGESGA